MRAPFWFCFSTDGEKKSKEHHKFTSHNKVWYAALLLKSKKFVRWRGMLLSPFVTNRECWGLHARVLTPKKTCYRLHFGNARELFVSQSVMWNCSDTKGADTLKSDVLARPAVASPDWVCMEAAVSSFDCSGSGWGNPNAANANPMGRHHSTTEQYDAVCCVAGSVFPALVNSVHRTGAFIPQVTDPGPMSRWWRLWLSTSLRRTCKSTSGTTGTSRFRLCRKDKHFPTRCVKLFLDISAPDLILDPRSDETTVLTILHANYPTNDWGKLRSWTLFSKFPFWGDNCFDCWRSLVDSQHIANKTRGKQFCTCYTIHNDSSKIWTQLMIKQKGSKRK